ncbi:hypothetical protein [Bacteroides caecimuris]|uniref:hypothetical protein n=1 Tax=Bacteroides caecimuris TaxID=1796613 RepID=UPI0026499405|nr:hypothetical protein [Bacteroides caecimuris]
MHGRLRWSLGTQCQSFRKSDYGRSRIQRNGTYARAGHVAYKYAAIARNYVPGLHSTTLAVARTAGRY